MTTAWHLKPHVWAFVKGRSIVLEKTCDMNAADALGLSMYKSGACDKWTLGNIARELGYGVEQPGNKEDRPMRGLRGLRGLLAYLWYVTRHKWFVTVECWKRGLLWRGLKHDLSKFRPSEFFPYARHFYNPDGSKRSARDKTGYYKPTDTGDADFDHAWFLHQKRNDHHWQWWMFPDDGPPHFPWKPGDDPLYRLKILPMSDAAAREMLCDWIGAGKAQGTPGGVSEVDQWYEKNRDKLVFHPDTRTLVERLLAERKR